MVARRLLIVLLLLLFVSSLATAIAPPPKPSEKTTTEKPDERKQRDRPRGRLIEASLNARTTQPGRVAMRVGDELELTVRTVGFDQVEIPGFGLFEVAEADDPAVFSLIARREGSFDVRANAELTIGTIEVSAR